MHRSPTARNVALLALGSCLALGLLTPVAPAAEAKVTFQHESQAAYEKQLAAGQIQAATFNKRVRSIHLTLKDGRHMLVRYPPHQAPAFTSQLQAKHVPVTVLKPAEAIKEASKIPVHHKIRYIVGGIVIAVIVIVAAVLLIDRRRKTAME
ncbi:MAG: hypothetical protein QOI89_1410 [Solirubrobacteraceae bacterium]|jgi:hypothetical protein|nr:hypothetical protein [Solirubrobacteraceae bacterium]